jgi:transposase InsO family protein
MLVDCRRRRGPRTTHSRHGFRKYTNLLKDRQLTGPHQAWRGGITYVRTDEGWLYVSLISDVWSRKIVGYCGAETLEPVGGLRALAMAGKQLPEDAHPIHHSDCGIQYCCFELLKSKV